MMKRRFPLLPVSAETLDPDMPCASRIIAGRIGARLPLIPSFQRRFFGPPGSRARWKPKERVVPSVVLPHLLALIFSAHHTRSPMSFWVVRFSGLLLPRSVPTVKLSSLLSSHAPLAIWAARLFELISKFQVPSHFLRLVPSIRLSFAYFSYFPTLNSHPLSRGTSSPFSPSLPSFSDRLLHNCLCCSSLFLPPSSLFITACVVLFTFHRPPFWKQTVDSLFALRCFLLLSLVALAPTADGSPTYLKLYA